MKRYIKADGMNKLRNLVDQVDQEIKQVGSVDKAIKSIANKFGLDMNGQAVKFLLDHYNQGKNIMSSSYEDDFGPGEHIPTPIEKVQKGDFFKLSDKPNGKVYVKDDYDRSERAYWCYEYYDVNSGRYFKKGKTVYTGFTF